MDLMRNNFFVADLSRLHDLKRRALQPYDSGQGPAASTTYRRFNESF